MKQYHKINSVFKRDASKPGHPIIYGDWSLPEFQYLANNQWLCTEKVDGMNIRIMFDGESVSFGGKTDNAIIPAKLSNRLRELFPDAERLKSVFDGGGVCLYGEGYGAGIQKGGGNYRPDQDFVLFDVKVGDWWLRREDVEDIAMKLDLDIVPAMYACTLFECVDIVKSGIYSSWGNFHAEGIVARPVVELNTRSGDRIITKIKYKDFQGV